jgi:carbamoyl-phosphate synthase large subunit
VTDSRVTALRLWARGWLLARPAATARVPAAPTPGAPAAGNDAPVAVARIPVPAATAGPAATAPGRPAPAGSPAVRSFARPSAPHPPETSR